jgi:hypothetical protein
MNKQLIHYVPVQLGNRVIRMILARFEAPDADGIHVLGVDEVGGGANRFPDFVLLGKYYLLKYLTHHHQFKFLFLR